MTDILETLNRLDEMEKEATPAPWKMYNAFSNTTKDLIEITFVERIGNESGGGIQAGLGDMSGSEKDFELIASLRNAYHAMAAEIRRLMEENASYAALIRHHDEHHAEAVRLKAENERMREALKELASENNWEIYNAGEEEYPTAGYEWINPDDSPIDIARRALEKADA